MLGGVDWEYREMKRLAVIVFIVITVSQYAAAAAKPKWAEPENWRQLQKFVTPNQVTWLLGQPGYIESTPGGPVWYYQKAPYLENGKVIRPKYAVAKFRKVPRGGFTLFEWSEPDWDNLPEFEVKPPEPDPNELAAEAARIEAQRLAEEKRRAEQKAKQAELARLREIEANKSFWEKRTKTEKYYICGGAAIAAILLVGLFYKKQIS